MAIFWYYSLSILCFLLPKTKSLNFSLTNIGTQHLNTYITTYPYAYISSQGLQLTSDERNSNLQEKAGKATYIKPLHLWDTSTGILADFYTHFTFVIDSNGNSSYADGLTFFLTPDGSNFTAGKAIGLPVDTQTMKPTSPFVAVEFDTFQNPGVDPINITPFTHVGIDVNSLISNVTAAWYCNVTQGIENEAWIMYDSSSKNLSVVFTGSINGTRIEDSIHLIVDLRDYLPEWVTFGFSAATGQWFEKNNVRSWEFISNLQLPKSKKFSRGVLMGLVFGLCLLVGGLVLIGFDLWKGSSAKELDAFEFEMAMENEFESGSGPKKFSYGQLSGATNNFDEEHKLGEGGFGGVYRGFLKESNSYIAVKRVSKGSKQGIKEYASEVKIIGRLRHRNLVQLIGWCHEMKELLLVYDFMENGSLDLHLFKGKSLLTWGTRYKVAQGLASALLYLHEEWEQCVVHRDIKSSNVMLDSNFNVKLGDFGLARLIDHEKESQTTMLAGTIGYLAPECIVKGKTSKESDVYSFGVVILEIVCGRRANFYNGDDDETTNLTGWVWDLHGRGKLLEAADLKLGEDFNEQEMERLLVVGLWCAHPDSRLRPLIRQAIQVLHFEAPSPYLPSVMPVATYLAPNSMAES